MLGVSQSRGLKLFGREIIFEEFQPIWTRYLNVTDGQTDGRLTVASPRSALASRGKKRLKSVYICRPYCKIKTGVSLFGPPGLYISWRLYFMWTCNLFQMVQFIYRTLLNLRRLKFYKWLLTTWSRCIQKVNATFFHHSPTTLMSCIVSFRFFCRSYCYTGWAAIWRHDFVRHSVCPSVSCALWLSASVCTD